MTRRYSRKGTQILYTALYSNYDILRDPIGNLPGWSLVAFSDRLWHTDCWKVIVEVPPDNPSLAARRKKVMFHELFPEARSVLWVDANIRVTADFVREMSKTKYDVMLSKHTHRDCVYQEAEACMHLGKDKHNKVHHQISKYFDEGYPSHNGMVETGVLFRKNKPSVHKLCETWWHEIESHSHRDQLSFNYACWKTGTKYTVLPESIRDSEDVIIMPHVTPSMMRPLNV